MQKHIQSRRAIIYLPARSQHNRQKIGRKFEYHALFRKSKGVELTEKGSQLYENTKKAFQILLDTEEHLKRSQNTGYLRIAASNVLCKHFLMPYLKEFTGHYPNTDLSITCTSSMTACSMVEQGRIDLALVAKPENRERRFTILWA